MERLFIEGRYEGNLNPDKIDTGSLPSKIGLFTTVQYVGFLEKIKEHLEKESKTVKLYKLSHYEGQVLGCSIKKIEGVEGILYVGDGSFHPIALGIENDIPVYIFNPINEKFFLQDKEVIERIKRKQKAAIASFFSSENIGVLVSLKEGQLNTKYINELKERFPEKRYYELVFDTLDFGQLENFPFIQCFVNTSCPRITHDDYEKFQKPIVEASKILEY